MLQLQLNPLRAPAVEAALTRAGGLMALFGLMTVVNEADNVQSRRRRSLKRRWKPGTVGISLRWLPPASWIIQPVDLDLESTCDLFC